MPLVLRVTCMDHVILLHVAILTDGAKSLGSVLRTCITGHVYTSRAFVARRNTYGRCRNAYDPYYGSREARVIT
jgi:hypothetical protein